ncbi:MAG TPA: RNA-binding domain-containing protein [Oculatellaceae cyanobacterium]|jgi:predicted HTH transcriptional regulator
MTDPREVFEYPNQHWSFLTAPDDTDFEGQYFDRKEAGRVGQNGCVSSTEMNRVVDQLAECISAFANTNKSGSLLVIGISTRGEVKGISHLSDSQRSRLTNFNEMLCNQAAQAKFFDCQNDFDTPDKICLIYIPYTAQRICETIGNSPRAWRRQGSQNIFLIHDQREQLKRDKKIVDFEQVYCCAYDQRDLDQAVLQEFRRLFLSESHYEYSDDELLYQIGALVRDGVGYNFTNAGLLFFASNPQRVIPASYIRLLRFETTSESINTRGLPTFEKKFSGSITKQIRDLRTFFKESGFFKLYQKRNPEGGGFIEEPEYPYIAVDEAIVNAVAHRDYAIGLPIECESYKDAFIVRNSGRLQQRDRDVPERFSLENTILNSTPRNPKLIEWLKMMRDERGAAFVRALSEGTKRMRDEMTKLNLPAPKYTVSESQTTVILVNNSTEREAALQSTSALPSTEFSNLFPLTFILEEGQNPDINYLNHRYQDIMMALKDALIANGWYIDSFKFSRLVAHRQGVNVPLSKTVDKFVRFYPAYSFQLRQYWGKLYLCLDYNLQVKNVNSLSALLTELNFNEFIGQTAVANWNGWQVGKIISVDNEWTKIYFFDFKQEEKVPNNKVIPNLHKALIERILEQHGIRFDLNRAIKQHSLASEPNAARIRAEKTQAVATDISQAVFPLMLTGMRITLQPSFVSLSRQRDSANPFQVYSLPEPSVEFYRHQESTDIREGITQFGAYDKHPKNIEIIPICSHELRGDMAALINRLKAGKYKYRGAERTFSTRFTYNSIITVHSLHHTFEECKRLLSEHPEWVGNEHLGRIFLVYTPEKGYAADDENSPYYRIKRLLLEKGIPCQMVDTPTIQNPDWKDLNLALNIVAKCGVTPWVLPDAIPDADFFVGLSYTQNGQRGSERLMGYANVFNQYGRWEFYSGNTETFAYDERKKYFKMLIKQTLERLTLSETPSIYFHYSAKFSQEDRKAILDAARSVRPHGTYTFVWLNMNHNVRLYNSRPETDGSLSRGSYVIASPHQIYLSTTGYNPYRKALGTPQMLEINVRTERPLGTPNSEPDLKALAVQVLSLTKLNWGSTDSLCAEPITTKYAGNIAYLTAAFLRQEQSFHLHPTLEKTPWFI